MSKVTLTEYFQAVDRRLAREGLAPTAGFRVKVCGQRIDLRFPTEALAQAGRSSIEGFVIDQEGEPDAAFLYWYDRCDAYLPEGEGEFSSVWQSQDATGSLRIGTDDDSLVGCDYVRQRYYFARPEKWGSSYMACRHVMVNAFARWAVSNGYYLLHAAAVGTGGKGVLVVGRGGSGKSTFAVSCLAAGLDFVSDDYALLSTSGPLVARPLYSVVALNPDMWEKLPQVGQPITEANGSFRGGKPQFQVNPERFSPGLEIQAIIMPKLTGAQEPTITPISPSKAMAQLIHSTITQIESRKDTGLVRGMAARLAQLPVYEMGMSTDLSKNPAFLRAFIEKEK